MVTAHYHSRVPPFGNSRIKAYLQLPQAFRSLSRPSSAISALASTLRSSSLDLMIFRSFDLADRLPVLNNHFPKTIEKRLLFLICVSFVLDPFTSDWNLP